MKPEKIQAPGQADEIHQACFAQPLSTAIQIALVELLSSWQIEAVATVGHSSGNPNSLIDQSSDG